MSDPRWAAVYRALQADHGAAISQNGEQGLDIESRDGDFLQRVGAVFGLQAAEQDVLLVAAAADLDPNIAIAYGLLRDPAGGAAPPSVALAMELAGLPFLDARGRLMLGETAPLLRWKLLQLGPGPLLLGRALTAGEDLLGALLGSPVPEATAAAMTVSGFTVDDLDEVPGETGSGPVRTLAAALTAGTPLVWVEAPLGAAGADTAVAAFDRANLASTLFDLALRPPTEPLVETIAALIRRCGLVASGMVLLSAELLSTEADIIRGISALHQAPVPIVLVARSSWNPAWHPELPVVVRAQRLSTGQRLTVWRRYVSGEQVSSTTLSPYRLTPRQIEAAGRHIVSTAALSGRPPDAVMIAETIRLLGGSHQLRRGTGGAPATFDELQVPADTRAALQRLADWVRLRDVVTSTATVDGHGGRGIAALFTGNPGTGKTLAAHVIADAVGLDLMQVDLSGVIDKYIGETEKNLERIFAEAESLNVVLFFDEADALFGSRSEVRDARDRYANQEVSYLLQRMEQFNGITVLATNLRGNLDPAFSRRLHFIVQFPDPDTATRRRMWLQMLSRAGVADPADPFDLDMLAATIELTGGAIRNIVVAAIFDAAIERSPIGRRHVVAAAHREYVKLGRRAPAGLA